MTGKEWSAYIATATVTGLILGWIWVGDLRLMWSAVVLLFVAMWLHGAAMDHQDARNDRKRNDDDVR